MITFAVKDLLRPSWVQGTNAHISMVTLSGHTCLLLSRVSQFDPDAN